MTKQITIEVSDAKYDAFPQIIGSIVGDATYLEAAIEIQEV